MIWLRLNFCKLTLFYTLNSINFELFSVPLYLFVRTCLGLRSLFYFRKGLRIFENRLFWLVRLLYRLVWLSLDVRLLQGYVRIVRHIYDVLAVVVLILLLICSVKVFVVFWIRGCVHVFFSLLNYLDVCWVHFHIRGSVVKDSRRNIRHRIN